MPVEPHEHLFLAALERAPARVGSASEKGALDVELTCPERAHRVEAQAHFDLSFDAAPTVHLDDTGDGPQIVGDLPIQERAKRHGVVPRPAHREVKDLAEARGKRAELRSTRGRGDRLACGDQTLCHELTRRLEIDVVVEHDGHGRDGGTRDGAHGARTGQARHRKLDGARDERLHLEGREAGGAREHLHLYARDVGHGIEGKAQVAANAEHHEPERGENHEQAIRERPRDDAADHVTRPRAPSASPRP